MTIENVYDPYNGLTQEEYARIITAQEKECGYDPWNGLTQEEYDDIHAQLNQCPKCGGDGSVELPEDEYTNQSSSVTCDMCDGNGTI